MKITILSFLMLSLSASVWSFDGESYFKTNCQACHTVGEGDRIGPDLAGVSKRRSLEWIVKFTQYPSGMINGDEEEPGYEKPDPVAVKLYALYKPMMMTEFDLDETKMKAILKYIDAQGKEPKGKILQLK